MPSFLKKVSDAVSNQIKEAQANRKVAQLREQKIKEKEETAYYQGLTRERVKMAGRRGRAKAHEPGTLTKIATGLGTLSNMADFDPFGEPKHRAPRKAKRRKGDITITVHTGNGSNRKTKRKKRRAASGGFNPLDW